MRIRQSLKPPNGIGQAAGLGKFIRKGLKQTLGLLYPACCAGCGRNFRPAPADIRNCFLKRLGDHLCPECMSKAEPIKPPWCSICGLPFTAKVGPDHLCGGCIRKPPVYARARAVFVFQDPVRRLIHGLKYAGQVNLAKPLGEILLQCLFQYWPDNGIDLVMPVPLYPAKERRRTFNQAWLMLRSWKAAIREFGFADPPFGLQKQVLVRRRDTDSQAGLNREQRRKNIRRAFEVVRPELVEGKNILLVDDVLTTGATAEACSRTLLHSGARQVDVLVLAKVV